MLTLIGQKVVEMCTGPARVSAVRTVEELWKIFAIHGLLQQLVSDNGPQFVSQQLAEFLKMKHFKSAPYHPAKNGLAEHFIYTMKKALKASTSRILYHRDLPSSCYRTSPHATTNRPVCELLMGRLLCMRLHFLKLSNESQALDQQAHQKANHDSHCKGREFVVGKS